MEECVYRQYQKDGFSESEIEQIWQDTLYFRNKMAEKKAEREITTSTYERAQRSLKKDVDNWFRKKLRRRRNERGAIQR